MHEVHINNNVGWSVENLQQFRSLPGVLRVDGRGLQTNDRFRQAVCFFRTMEEAHAFTKTLADVEGGEAKIIF